MLDSDGGESVPEEANKHDFTPIDASPLGLRECMSSMPLLYLIRFSQTHETFRLAELEALERLVNEKGRVPADQWRRIGGQVRRIGLEIVYYDANSPFCVVRFRLKMKQCNGQAADTHAALPQPITTNYEEDEVMMGEVAKIFISRGVQAKGIYELWGFASTAEVESRDDSTRTNASMVNGTSTSLLPALYESLHRSTRAYSSHRWQRYQKGDGLKFKFNIDSFNHSRTMAEQREVIDSFAYLDFKGVVRMKGADQEWVLFEEWIPRDVIDDVEDEVPHDTDTASSLSNIDRKLKQVFFGRQISPATLRPVCEIHDLKKRPYISTTSMDAELALITANLSLASPGKIFLDPFCGTGGFLVAAAELGAWVLGSDIDGRSFRGKSTAGIGKGVGRNIDKYKLASQFGGCMTSDLINSPLRLNSYGSPAAHRWLDGIICDPPYGVREGLKVLGIRRPPTEGEDAGDSIDRRPRLIDGVPAHTLPGYVAPKRPYSFDRMLDDILAFAVQTLVDGGRLAFWMPSANEDETGQEIETEIPTHEGLKLLHVCVQRFNRWSRRLIVYERVAGDIGTDRITDGIQGLRLDPGLKSADALNPFRRRYFQAFAVDDRKSNCSA
jgi:tRNA (guanine10-N2)-methyltransferase